MLIIFFFSSRRRHTRFDCDWSSDVCSSDLATGARAGEGKRPKVGCAASSYPPHRCARRVAQTSKREVAPRAASREAKEAPEETRASRQHTAGLSGKANHGSSRRGFPVTFLSTGVAVVTGAGSGIGRSLAQRLAAGGSALALAALYEAGLLETLESLGSKSAAVSTHVMDVAEEAHVSAFAEDVRRQHGPV